METIAEDAVADKDSEEVTLHCSIIGYHIAIFMEYGYGELNMLQYMREFTWCGWILNWHSDDQIHKSYVAAVKKQLDIFHDVFHVLFSCFSYSCQVIMTLMIFYRLTSTIVACSNHKINYINYSHSRLYAQQTLDNS